MNSLFKQLNPNRCYKDEAPVHVRGEVVSSADDVVEEMAGQNFQMNIGDFMRFMKMMQGRDADSVVRQLLQSGRMSQQQFDSLKTKAQGFIKLYNHFKK